MAKNYVNTGVKVKVTAAAARTSGQAVREENWNGIVQDDAANGADYILNTEGVYELAVPVGTVRGDCLYITAALAITKTSTGNYNFGRATTDRDTSGNSYVKLEQTDGNLAAA
ncbi:MAG TPA: DUF2190 family protein [Actinobacteria bacterium]|nr:DUF2190 family protein [Actinomycetes bacterium]HEX21403.1 DUF2190 family protein [Actinomycetota bacterium]